MLNTGMIVWQVLLNVSRGWSPLPRRDPARHAAVGCRQRHAGLAATTAAVHGRPRLPAAALQDTRGIISTECSSEGENYTPL